MSESPRTGSSAENRSRSKSKKISLDDLEEEDKFDALETKMRSLPGTFDIKIAGGRGKIGTGVTPPGSRSVAGPKEEVDIRGSGRQDKEHTFDSVSKDANKNKLLLL